MRGTSMLTAALGILVVACQAQDRSAEPNAAVVAAMDEAQQGPSAKIAEAMSAAPAAIADNATIMDWPHMEGGEFVQLRAGTNEWVCYPSTAAATPGAEDPMCLDPAWQEFAGAWVSRTQPQIRTLGIGYMLRGDIGASNIDPYATEPTADNEWVVTGPHIMIVVPDVRHLEGLPTDPSSGGPYVMWQGTPYAHIMIPVQ